MPEDWKQRREAATRRRAEQAAAAPAAMADYVKARNAVLDRMVQLRTERMKRQNEESNGAQQNDRTA